MTHELSPRDLYRACDPDGLFTEPSSDSLRVGQERGLEALDTALGVRRPGYHVFVVGPAGLGKRTLVRDIVRRHAAARSQPFDWCYLKDFANPRKPRALRLAAGVASTFRGHMKGAIERVQAEVAPHAPGTLQAGPARDMVRRCLEPARSAFAGHAAITEWLAAAEVDIVASLLRPPRHDDGPGRYEVNVVADQTAGTGAPVIEEPNPTRNRIIGRIDQQTQFGMLVTDVHLIRAGALHRANGGFLLIDALDLIRSPDAWYALVRALRTQQISIEPVDTGVSLASLEPEPIPLDVQVILFGERELYDQLVELAPELRATFGVVADFTETIERTRDTEQALARSIATMAHASGTRPIDRGALACMVEHAARLAPGRLSLHRRTLGDLLVEADDRAKRAGRSTIDADDVVAALDAQRRRTSLPEQHYLEAVRSGIVEIETSGRELGRTNALAVAEYRERAIGFPRRVSARTRLGGGEVIDIEREVELGGPLHSKGVLVLAGFLGARFGQHAPLTVAATIVFEQSHEGIEGDSASLAETCALLSAIGEFPIDQSIAVTGAITQHGNVHAVGGVNEKIEGLFDICRVRGLTGTQGVIIPRTNVQHLMLRRDVIAAVAEGRFHIYDVDHVDAAITLLSGLDISAVENAVEARLARFAEDTQRFMHADRSTRPPAGRWSIAAQRLRP